MALLGLVSWSLLVDAVRLASICFFLLCSLSFNWYSFSSIIAILVSLYILDRNKYNQQPEPNGEPFADHNPYKRHRRVKDEEKVPAEIWDKYTRQILDLVLYDVEDCEALRNFETVKNNTHCIFSKRSVLWGARDYDKELTLEQNVTRSLPAFTKLIAVGSTLHLDGFLLELPGEEFSQDVESFGEGVRRVLKCISDADPIGYCCMNKSFLSKVGWSFEYAGEPVFVTTFSACYPENHSRYTFGVASSFILLQPMYSFAIHNISPETPHTNWECPVTERDKIRVAYKANDRGYLIRETVIYPPAHDIVKPLVEGPGNLLEWWKDPHSSAKNDHEVAVEDVAGREDGGSEATGNDGDKLKETKKKR